MKKSLKILLTCMFIMGSISTSAVTSNKAHASTDPSLVLHTENQDSNTGSYANLNDKADVLKTKDEGTMNVKYRYTGNAIISLFSLISNTHIKSNQLMLSSIVDHTVAAVMDKNTGYKFFSDGALIKQDITSLSKFLSNIYAQNSSKIELTGGTDGGYQYSFTGYNNPLSDTALIDKTHTVNTEADLNTIKTYISSTSASTTFLFTGGNMTFASGLSEGYRNYIQLFEERIRWEIAGSQLQRRNFVFNTQSKGMTASELLTEFNNRVTQFQPKTVFVNLGYDDAIHNTNIETYKASLKNIVSQIRGIGAVPVLQTPIYPSDPQLADNMTLYVNAMKAVAQEDNVLFMNHYETWKNYNDRVPFTATDGVTPNEKGHLLLSKDLMSFFSIGGNGYTWDIYGFNDTKEPQLQFLDQNVSYAVYQDQRNPTVANVVYQNQLNQSVANAVYQGQLTVNLDNSLSGISNIESVSILLTSDDGQLLRETSSTSGSIYVGTIELTKPYTLKLKIKKTGDATLTVLNTAYINTQPPAPVTVPNELTVLLQGSNPVTWLFSGDSITHGALHTKGYKSFVQLFEERVKGELSEQYPARAKDMVLNTGVSGMTSRDLMENFDRWITLNKADVVFIAFGMNDSSNRAVPLDEYTTNLKTAVDRVREMGSIPILETINIVKPVDNTRKTNLPAYVNAVRNIAQEKNVYLIDHYQYWLDAEQQDSHIQSIWLNDTIHPNYIGSTHMAAAIFQALGLEDPASYISNLRYLVTPVIEPINSTPIVSANAQSISVEVAPIVSAAGGAAKVEKVYVTLSQGASESIQHMTRQTNGTIMFNQLTQPGTYTIQVKVKLKGQNKELLFNNATVTW